MTSWRRRQLIDDLLDAHLDYCDECLALDQPYGLPLRGSRWKKPQQDAGVDWPSLTQRSRLVGAASGAAIPPADRDCGL